MEKYIEARTELQRMKVLNLILKLTEEGSKLKIKMDTLVEQLDYLNHSALTEQEKLLNHVKATIEGFDIQRKDGLRNELKNNMK